MQASPHAHRHTNSPNPHLTPLLKRRCSLSECTMEGDFHTLFLYLSPWNVMMRMIQMEMTTELGSPHYFPLSDCTLCTGVWAARFTAQGHTFPHAAFPSSKENEDGAETSPNTLILLWWCFCGCRVAANTCSYPERPQQQKRATREFPNLIRKEYRGLGKYNFSWDSHTAMTWITAVCWWHPVLVKSH